MNKLVVESWALLLLFAAFPLISFGTTAGQAPVWWLGLLCLISGALLPVITRFVGRTDTPDRPETWVWSSTSDIIGIM
jgi:hypothetical protein